MWTLACCDLRWQTASSKPSRCCSTSIPLERRTWRFGRLAASERTAFEDLILRLRPAFDKSQNAGGDQALKTTIAYASVISTYQRDVKYRVAGFIEAFLDIKAEMGQDFPRMSPDLKPYRSLAAAPTLAQPARSDGSAKPPSLVLPRQLVISAAPDRARAILRRRQQGRHVSFAPSFMPKQPRRGSSVIPSLARL